MMATLQTLETPCLVLDRVVMERNVQRLRERLRAVRVPLRPHLKTSKSIDIARRLIHEQPGGVAVSTLAEAEHFAGAGFRDILYAVAIAPNKLAHAAALARSGVRLRLLIDDESVGQAASAAAKAESVEFSVLLEVDVDGHRSGVDPHSSKLVKLATTIQALPGLTFQGILSHAGSSYDCSSIAAISDVADREREEMLAAREALARAGVACPEISVGSTPTVRAARCFEGITEVRAGVFVFNDLMQAELGGCAVDDIALSVLTRVIGHYAARNRLIIDAGWMALSLESQMLRGTRIFGRLAHVNGSGCCDDDLVVTGLNQEHGIVTRLSGRPISANELPIGTPLRVVPVHACSTAAAHDRYHVVENGVNVIEVWRRVGGWSSPR